MVRVISGDAWINEVCALRRAPDGSHISHEPSFTDMGSSDIFQEAILVQRVRKNQQSLLQREIKSQSSSTPRLKSRQPSFAQRQRRRQQSRRQQVRQRLSSRYSRPMQTDFAC